MLVCCVKTTGEAAGGRVASRLGCAVRSSRWRIDEAGSGVGLFHTDCVCAVCKCVQCVQCVRVAVCFCVLCSSVFLCAV